MKIGIVSLATKEIEDMSIAILNKQDYCKKHNYTFINYKERQSKRHCPWDKIQCLLKTIHWFDYIVWIDADAVFQNLSITFESIIQEHPEKDVLICKDPCFSTENHCMINTGVIIMKNTYISIQLLKDTWHSCQDYDIHELNKYSYEGYPHEQGTLATLLRTEKYSSCYFLYEQAKFNTHPTSSNKETFIIHFMGSRQTVKHRIDFVDKIRQIARTKENVVYYTPTKKYKLAIVTMYTENIKSYGEISTENKENYCKKYNIDLIVTKERLSTRHPAWDKIKCVENAMKGDYDYIIWMDADSIFVNDTIDFNTLLNIYDKNFIVCLDPYAPVHYLDTSIDYNLLHNLHIINTGIFIIKNNQEMKDVISSVWNTKTNTNVGLFNPNKEVLDFNWEDWPYEQGAFHVIFSNRKDIELLPDKSFNAIPDKTHKYSFILHNMGGRTDVATMIQTFNKYKNVVIESQIATIKKEVIFALNDRFIVPLHIEINKSFSFIEIKFQWKLPKDKVLSHIFKINGSDYYFNSDPEGRILISTTKIVIEHTYEYFGALNWEYIGEY
jgi:hypothetical protein